METNTIIHDEAQAQCAKHNAMLPEPRSQQENDFVNSLTVDYLFLLGINDKKKEGTWVWDSDATPVVYENWYPGEPTNHGNSEHCGVMMGKMWWDINCLYDKQRDSYPKVLICQQKRTYMFFSFLNILFGVLL